MKILLIAPRFIQKAGQYYEFPVGLAYISASLKQALHEVSCLNLNHDLRDTSEVVRRAITEFKPDAICTGGLSPHFRQIEAILSAAEKTAPLIPRIVGGGIISSTPELMMEHLAVTIGVLGEGERTILELMEALACGVPLESVAGLIHRTENGTQRTAQRPAIEDLGSLPFPDYEGFGFAQYLDNQYSNDTYYLYPRDHPRIVPMISSRSCPLDCTFCFHPLGRGYRKRPLDDFFGELDQLVGKFGINMVAVLDELFAVDKARVMEFCRRIKPYDVDWGVQLRVHPVDEEMIEAMKGSGCFSISYGIESINDGILKSMRKKTRREQIDKALKLTRKHQIEIQGNLIFGDRQETVETSQGSLRWWQENKRFGVNLGFIIPFPGCSLYEESVNTRRIENPAGYIAAGCPIINMSQMADKEFAALMTEVWSSIADPANHTLADVQTIRRIEDHPEKGPIFDISFHCPECGQPSRYPRFNIDGFRLHDCMLMAHCRHCHQRLMLFRAPLSACSEPLQRAIADDTALRALYERWCRLLSLTREDWMHSVPPRLRG